LELVGQDAAHRSAERMILVLPPQLEVFADAVDLDGLQGQLHAHGTQQAARPDDQPKLDAVPELERVGLALEELPPESDVLLLDVDEPPHHLAQLALALLVQLPVERQIEQLFLYELMGQRGVQGRHAGKYIILNYPQHMFRNMFVDNRQDRLRLRQPLDKKI